MMIVEDLRPNEPAICEICREPLLGLNSYFIQEYDKLDPEDKEYYKITCWDCEVEIEDDSSECSSEEV